MLFKIQLQFYSHWFIF